MEFFSSERESKKRMASKLLLYQTEFGYGSENFGKRGFIKFGQPSRCFVGICEVVLGVQIRWPACLIYCFFDLSSLEVTQLKRKTDC